MTTDRKIPDLAERSRALDPAQSFIVQAPAGSGKTELLIQRYLRLLACVNHPEEIVAVTFTRKAASEMRERVLQAMNAVRAGIEPESAHEQLTFNLAAAAMQRDAEMEWRIVDNPARLRIQTIDSLCAALTRQMPMLSRFGSQPESMEDADELYLEAARATVGAIENNDSIAEDLERLLTHLDNDVARTETLLVDMLRRRDHWLRLVSGGERVDLEVALRNARRAALQRACALFPAVARDEALDLLRYAAANLVDGSDSSYLIDLKYIYEFPGAAERDADAWLGLVTLLLAPSSGDWRKRYTVKEGFPAGEGRSGKEIAKRWKERALELNQSLAGNDAFRAVLDDLHRLPPPAYSDQQWEILGSILRLLPLAVAQLKLVFQSRGQVDFVEVAQGALRALGDSDAPTDLALALDYRIHHLLIDEFQDTSISQYELVARLTAGWNAGDGRSIFAVGDPMQSIYRFREAEVGLFLRARATGIGSVELHPIALSANFRSQAGIVDWVNATFAQVMPARADVAAGAVPYTASIATRERLAGAAVNVHPLFGDDGSIEAQRVAEVVIAARQADPAARVAILVRTRGHLRDIVPALKAANLRFRAIDIDPLGQRPVVQDLLALTRALMHPADRVAWLAVLRAPWCGLTLADLHVLAAAQSRMTLWEALQDESRVAQLSADGRARLLRVRMALAASLEKRVRGPLREHVAGAWYALGGPACVAQETDLEDAETYFRYLDAHEDAGELPDRSIFEDGLAQLYALPDVQADDSLQIMTVHKAKGLEFDVVIVPGLARSPRSDDKKLFLWTEQPGATGETDLLLAPINASGEDGDPIYKWVERLHAEKQSLEAGRLLYVATTRAIRQLHLLGSVKTAVDKDGVVSVKAPSAQSLLGKLWPVVASHYETALRDLTSLSTVSAESVTTISQTLRRLPAAWTLPEAPPAVAWEPLLDVVRTQDDLEFSWAGETARRIGSVVHRWLQRFAEDGVTAWDATRIKALEPAIRHALAAQGVVEYEIAAAAARVQLALTACIADARGRWVLDAHHEGRSELRLSGIVLDRRMDVVIDRTFDDDEGVRWIIDYKTSVHEGADAEAFLDNELERYRAQLERYAALMHGSGVQRIRLGLYFPLLGGWREWDYVPH